MNPTIQHNIDLANAEAGGVANAYKRAYSNTCIVQETDTNYYGTGMVACYSSPYKSRRIYLATTPDAEIVEDENNDYCEMETGEPLWFICCERPEVATALCDALNKGAIELP